MYTKMKRVVNMQCSDEEDFDFCDIYVVLEDQCQNMKIKKDDKYF